MPITLPRSRMEEVTVPAMEKLAPVHRPLRKETDTPDIHGNRRLARHGLGAANRWGITPDQLVKADWGWTRWRWLPHPAPVAPYSVSHQLRILKPPKAGISSSFRTWGRSTNSFMDVLSKSREGDANVTQTKNSRYLSHYDTSFVPGWARDLESDVQITRDRFNEVITRLREEKEVGKDGRPTSSRVLNNWLNTARRVQAPGTGNTVVSGTTSSTSPGMRTTPVPGRQHHQPRTPLDQTDPDPSNPEQYESSTTLVESPNVELPLQLVLRAIRNELVLIKDAYQNLNDKFTKYHRLATQGGHQRGQESESEGSTEEPQAPKPPGQALGPTTPTVTSQTDQILPPLAQSMTWRNKHLELQKAKCEQQAKRQQRVIDYLLDRVKALSREKSPNEISSILPNNSADTSMTTAASPLQTASQANTGAPGTQPLTGQPGGSAAIGKMVEEKMRQFLGIAATTAQAQDANIASTGQVQASHTAPTSVHVDTAAGSTATSTNTPPQGTAAQDPDITQALAILAQALSTTAIQVPVTGTAPNDTASAGTIAAAQDPNRTRALAIIRNALAATGTGAPPTATATTTQTVSTGADAPTHAVVNAATNTEDPKTPPPTTERVIVRGQEQIHALFRSLRLQTRQFSYSAAFQLDSPMLFETDVQKKNREKPFCPPELWERLNRDQRANRICQLIFMWLWRQILRPGVESFGVKPMTAELESSERGSQEEIATPFQRLSRAIAPLGDKIFRTLSPVIQFEFARNEHLVRRRIWKLCHDAALLKMMFREGPGKQMRVEVPGAHGDQTAENKWMERGFDDLTHALPFQHWVRVIDLEKSTGKRTISCVPFGALTMVEDGKKVVLERAWIVGNANEGSGLFVLQRKSPEEVERTGPGTEHEEPNESDSGETEDRDVTEDACETEHTGDKEMTGETAKLVETETISEGPKPDERQKPTNITQQSEVIVISSEDADGDESESESEHDDLIRDPTWRPTGSTGQSQSGEHYKRPVIQLIPQDTILDALRRLPPSTLTATDVPPQPTSTTSTDPVPTTSSAAIPWTSSTAPGRDADVDGQNKKKKRKRPRMESDPDWIPGQTDGETEPSTRRR
ncbi:hypothetical protein QC764_301030 [Podospora pseudoanserina]|uniref:Uncharacterized protein n=1 Tax=Podospora pseudoanserina TaxID=2609844 RepID=A0ABR0IC14_9PEZI|nr:hypothetical protein QC764_301030 [Podospora pseudoanserina]